MNVRGLLAHLWLALPLVLGSAAAGCHAAPSAPPTASSPLTAPPARPQLMFISVASDDTFHHVGVASVAHPTAGAFITPLQCERAYFNGQHGICLTSTQHGADTLWWGQLFNERFEPGVRVPLTGAPSRVRVSPNGTLAAVTVFESGHAYSDSNFSTKTSVVSLPDGASLGDLEAFDTFRDNKRIRAADFNFWGVTFASDSDTFYATLDTKGVSSLVRGSVRARRMDVVKAGVECPSLSPDNTRIAFKKRVGARSLGWWQIAVMRLDTMDETLVTTETRSVDDQVEWLDDASVLYHLTGGANAADLWTVRVDNSAPPQVILPAAYSPTVVR